MAYDKSVPFSFTKNGIYYFERRVPSDLRKHYSASKISYSLRSRSTSVATSRAMRAAQQLDDYWYHLRIMDSELPGKHLLRMQQNAPNASKFSPSYPFDDSASVSLSEAVAMYLRLKGQNRPVTFHRAAERACGYVIDVCGDKSLVAYSRADATRFRDALVERKLTGSSITRIFGTVRSVVNFTASEVGVTMTNPFTGVYYDRKSGVQERAPLPVDVVKAVQRECMRIDDDVRWLVALVSDTGLRLAEAAGLLREDIVLDADIPHVVVREHPWRRLKTSSSTREVPLAEMSLWAGRRILEHGEDSPFAFARYNRGDDTNANSASAALNKWMRPLVPERCTMHSFRHSMRDRLRAVECPSDIVDQIGGWQTEGVGQTYGHGYPLEVLNKWLELAVE
jgi:integrase